MTKSGNAARGPELCDPSGAACRTAMERLKEPKEAGRREAALILEEAIEEAERKP